MKKFQKTPYLHFCLHNKIIDNTLSYFEQSRKLQKPHHCDDGEVRGFYV